MTTRDDLKVLRRAYAKQILAVRGLADARIEAAFAAVPREAFLGRGPWPILRMMAGYVTTPSADPVFLYSDDLVGLLPERQLNNGQPSLHAFLLHEAMPCPGEHLVHIGAGTGYYSAVMAELVGPAGRVTAVEFDPELAAQAEANLADRPNVTVLAGDGATLPFDPADVVYVNAGATRPADLWLDRLRHGGRLVLPLTTDANFNQSSPGNLARRGAIFLITRADEHFGARWISPVGIFPCAGARDPESEAALAAALENEGWEKVARLYRRDDLPEDRCWLRAPGWCLAYA